MNDNDFKFLAVVVFSIAILMSCHVLASSEAILRIELFSDNNTLESLEQLSNITSEQKTFLHHDSYESCVDGCIYMENSINSIIQISNETRNDCFSKCLKRYN